MILFHFSDFSDSEEENPLGVPITNTIIPKGGNTYDDTDGINIIYIHNIAKEDHGKKAKLCFFCIFTATFHSYFRLSKVTPHG